MVDIEKTASTDFGEVIWQFKELTAYKKIKEENKNVYEAAGMPFVVSLSELMSVAEIV